MDLSKLAELKRMVSFDAQLAPVFKYFLTHFAEMPGFIQLGERVYRHPVEAIIEAVGNELHIDPGPINKLALIRIPEHHFVHGSFFIGFRIGGVIYFEDIEVGIMNLCEGLHSPDVKFVRFSDAHRRKPGDPHHN